MKKVVIVGAGASGLMAGIAAARAGAQVTILEHTPQIGKKIRVTGNGRCNLTNTDQSPEHYRGTHPEFAMEALRKFSMADTVKFFGELGIYTKNRNGYLYPHSDQAADVAEVLRAENEHQHVKISCNSVVRSIHVNCEAKIRTNDHINAQENSQDRAAEVNGKTDVGNEKDQRFLIETESWTYPADALILCTGSKAAPKTGSDGSGYPLAEQLGHRIITPLPALVQLKAAGKEFQKLAGIRAEAKVTLRVEDTPVCSDQGEVQLTGYGISGIPVFQVSRFAAEALEQQKKVQVWLDFFPEFTADNLMTFFKQRIQQISYKRMGQFFTGMLPGKLSEVLLIKAGLKASEPVGRLSPEGMMKLILLLKAYPVDITGTNSFDQAQTCAGGVDTREVDPGTMESGIVPGLYLAGELLDIDGACGGYNLQWAWTSGYIAGTSAAGGRLQRKEQP
ncbi:NAD(P)/FAD-dependent oxidoreductase [Lachnospiraceae bacterium ASD3451]|uniref:NAD(P)/FAD-dependent oxidoreductase n=1 Tax=Diplocloster agilis TaxID=2850323 RepID=UPI001E0502BC|nr:NAD(P)/FAD-dependent oxidoreductase [Diplocloster agilis]MBU9743385.1 NAD(P)/FAD-dependent oxidoreductase [Diplocloster agilis]